MPRHLDVSPASPATTPTENPHAAKSEKKKKQAKSEKKKKQVPKSCGKEKRSPKKEAAEDSSYYSATSSGGDPSSEEAETKAAPSKSPSAADPKPKIIRRPPSPPKPFWRLRENFDAQQIRLVEKANRSPTPPATKAKPVAAQAALPSPPQDPPPTKKKYNAGRRQARSTSRAAPGPPQATATAASTAGAANAAMLSPPRSEAPPRPSRSRRRRAAESAEAATAEEPGPPLRPRSPSCSPPPLRSWSRSTRRAEVGDKCAGPQKVDVRDEEGSQVITIRCPICQHVLKGVPGNNFALRMHQRSSSKCLRAQGSCRKQRAAARTVGACWLQMIDGLRCSTAITALAQPSNLPPGVGNDMSKSYLGHVPGGYGGASGTLLPGAWPRRTLAK